MKWARLGVAGTMLWFLACAAVGILFGTFMSGCKPAMVRVEEIKCPIEVPPDIIAAYLGCAFDREKNQAICETAYQVPALTLDACDMVEPDDGGACE